MYIVIPIISCNEQRTTSNGHRAANVASRARHDACMHVHMVYTGTLKKGRKALWLVGEVKLVFEVADVVSLR